MNWGAWGGWGGAGWGAMGMGVGVRRSRALKKIKGNKQIIIRKS